MTSFIIKKKSSLRFLLRTQRSKRISKINKRSKRISIKAIVMAHIIQWDTNEIETYIDSGLGQDARDPIGHK